MQFYAIQSNIIRYYAISCNTIEYNTMPCNTMQYNEIPSNIRQNNTKQKKKLRVFSYKGADILAPFLIFAVSIFKHLRKSLKTVKKDPRTPPN